MLVLERVVGFLLWNSLIDLFVVNRWSRVNMVLYNRAGVSILH